MILDTIYTLLSTQSPLLAGGRIFPSRIPQGQLFPAIVYQRDTTAFDRTFDGHMSLTASGFQIDCYAKTLHAAVTLAGRVKTLLIDYAVGSVNLIRLTNELDLFEADTELHRVLLQFTVWHQE